MLIAIEGIDGAGKTSLAKFLEKELQKLGFDVVIFKEPTKSELGKKIMESSNLSPEEELELFILDRKYDVENNIRPALEQGKVVIMDRYYYSTMAYQGALGLDINEIRRKNEEIAPEPGLVIFLDLDPEKAIKRVSKRGRQDRFEDPDYLKKVREIFLSLNDKMVVLDAEENPQILGKKALKLILEQL
ncbi:MAG TPA: dTMP kinase [Archaeoglobaceae archaeon]|nr:dTMP kinase [Archaeoglobaceae archaeon]